MFTSVSVIPEVSDSAAIFLLAILQGIAEFLPISSSGHLVLAHVALGAEEGSSLALDVALHVGTLAAVVIAYRRDVRSIIMDVFRGRLQTATWLIVATIPIGVIGMLAKDAIEAMFSEARVAAGGLVFTAIVLLVAERARVLAARSRGSSGGDPEEPGREPTLADAIVMGFAQAVAILPGVSRSGMTISAGLLRGLSTTQAARYSFLMSIPAVTGAAVVTLPDAVDEGLGGLPISVVLMAVALAALVGWAALRALLLTLARGSFRWFAAYCAVLGGAVLVFA
jgi:undecaprenyl-diphosphatase